MQARRSHVVTLFAGIAIGMLIVGTAAAVTSRSFTYSKPKIGYLSLSTLDFSSDRIGNTSADYRIDMEFLTNTDVNRYFVAGVHLPNGAKILSATFWYSSTVGAGFIGNLGRSALAVQSSDDLVRVQPTDSSGNRLGATDTVDPSMQTVNNGVYAYNVYAGLKDGQTFYGARIKYSYTSAGA